MPIATGSDSELGYLRETVPGSAATGEYRKIRRTSAAELGLKKEAYDSEETRVGRSLGDSRHGTRRAEGGVETELSVESYDDLWLAVMGRSEWVKVYGSSMGVSVVMAAAPYNTITRPSSSFLADGLLLGDRIQVSAGNIGHMTVIGISANGRVLTVDKDLVAWSGTANIYAYGKRATVGSDLSTFSLERAFRGLSPPRYETLYGVAVASVNVQLDSEGLATATWLFLGKNAEPLSTTSRNTVDGGLFYTSVSNTQVISSTRGFLSVSTPSGSRRLATVTEFEFTIDNGLDASETVGRNDLANIAWGTSQEVHGSLTALFEDALLYDVFEGEEEATVHLHLDGRVAEEYLSFTLPRCKFETGDIGDAVAEGLPVEMSFIALSPQGAAGVGKSQISISTSTAVSATAAATLTYTPPWEVPFTPHPLSKMVVIANSSVSWSYSTCFYYCQERGIPTGNIFSVAFGNGGGAAVSPTYWASGGRSGVLTNLIQPLRTKLQGVQASAIIIGAGCPIVVDFEDVSGVVNQRIGLAELCSVTLGFKDAQLTAYHVATGSGWALLNRTISEAGLYQGQAFNQTDSFFGQAYPENLKFTFNSSGVAVNVTLETTSTFLSSHDFDFPTPTITEAMADGGRFYSEDFSAVNQTWYLRGRPHLPVARLGWSSYGGGYAGGPPVAETEALVIALIDRTTAAMAAHDVSQARAKRVRFHLTPEDGGIRTDEHWARFYVKCREWGLNAEYAHFSTVSSLTQTLAPASGSKYSETNIAAGFVAQPAYFITGGWANTGELSGPIYSPPYSVAFPALPGGSMMHGPSDGFQYSLNNLTGGGSVALTDNTHVTTGHIGVSHYSLFHNLLRGMSWLEASAYGRFQGNEACGDPLWAPYRKTPWP